MKYHKGDIIVGNDDAGKRYFITKRGVVCRVIGEADGYDESRIFVEIISGGPKGLRYNVDPKCFDLVRKAGVKLG